MTPVGHCLVGATVGVLYCYARQLPVRSHIAVIAGMVFCANLPDCPLPGWGHSRYEISHSLFVGMVLVLGYVIAARCFGPIRRSIGSWPLIAAGTCALFSHYLLDSFYNHGKGVAVFWPVSSSRLTLPIPWFETMTTDPLWCWHNFRVWGIELVCYGFLFLIVLFVFPASRKPLAK